MVQTATDRQTATDGKLGDNLLTLRGVQWILGTKDDPYALLLRAASDDPRELGRRLRERGPLSFSHAMAWVTASAEPGEAVLGDARLSPRHPDDQAETAEDADPGAEAMPWDIPVLRKVLPLRDAFVTLDRAEYVRLARWAEPVTAGALERHREAIADRYRARVRHLPGEFDLMTDLARGVSAAVVADLLGLPDDRRERFAELCAGTAGTLDATFCPPRLTAARDLLTSLAELRELLGEVIESARTSPGEGLAGGLLRAAADDAEAGPDDVLAVCVLLAVVGSDTAANLVCEAVASLLDHPDQWKLVRDDPGLASAAVEETLRYAPPIRLHQRYAQEDLELAGQRIEAGQEVVVVAEAANRDPALHSDPDGFDIRRPEIRHLTFPDGSPVALVASLARAQAAAAVAAVAAGLPDLRRADGVLRRLRSPATAAVLRLPVRTG
ncbi:P450-derived glycosyltransferase activator [Actinomadura fulvescens]|uniref:Cytochrome P450 n=1 Tax=Actinomadura fulvescens TaxID=46160 RepID=A0ABP6CEM3_9ACTN